MNKKFITCFLLALGLATTSQGLLQYQSKLVLSNAGTALESAAVGSFSAETEEQIKLEGLLLASQQTLLEKEKEELAQAKIVAVNSSPENEQPMITSSLSRGGTGLSKPVEKTQSKNNSSDIQLLDWWKSGRTVFSIGTTAEVKDLYTGKTFMVQRTMGTNHADSEALTKKDTDIIKSIWGGFSWARRPVILTINGSRYAASMSAMPHAGLDSAPANAVIDNRSEGYGRGQNLDIIKGNGMDGHFDIHFLNSTRHLDNQKDPEHQAAVLKAAGK